MRVNLFLSLALGIFHFSLLAQEQEIKPYLDSASAYHLSGDTMEVHYLNKAIKLQPLNSTLYELRAYAKSYVQADNNSKYSPQSIIRDFDVAIELNPKNANLYEQRGYQKFLLKNYQQALKDYNKSIKLDKKNSSAYRKRGDLFWEYKNYPRAGNDFYIASQLDTASVYNLRKVGDCFYELGNLHHAIRYYDLAIIKAENKLSFNDVYNEDYILSILYKANSRAYMGDLDQAIKDYSVVIDYNEKFQGILDYTLEAYKSRGMAYVGEEKFKEACNDFKKAQSLGDKEVKELIESYCK